MSKMTFRPALALLLLSGIAACAPAAPPPAAPGPTPGAVARRPGALPPVPPRSGPLVIDVVYPTEGQTMAVRDSNFIFGNVGTGQATVTIDGARVDVAPNGAFLAFLPVPSDGRYDVQ
ncbi:MAG: hypothetical protein KY464_12710, partial [Gemmatimonadetes bacterium]|nr:hypothetical protein [Gemmatimonadota bacterium]